MKQIVFLDRDGTLIVEPAGEQVDSLDKLEFVPGVFHSLRILLGRGFELVMVSNQDRLGSDRYPLDAFEMVQSRILRAFEGESIRFAHVLICPHGENDGCSCRKPKTGLVEAYLRDTPVDRSRSFMIGDRSTDVAFGRNIGVRTLRIAAEPDPDAERTFPSLVEACTYLARQVRTALIDRTTHETRIRGTVCLDGTGIYDIATGIGFFDHMLEQLSRHSAIDLTLRVDGDLRVDEHHTVEDVGLALGDAIRRALGEKKGIERYGFLLPMDESEAKAALDIGGRPYLVFEAAFERERVGELPTELVEDFFRAFADGLRANLHLAVTGRNDHHKAEALFKAVARTLRQAIQENDRTAGQLPTTKGVL